MSRSRITLAQGEQSPAADTPRQEVEVVALRESAVVSMARIGALNDVQIEAAFRFRNLVQSANADAGRAFNEYLDGGEFTPRVERVSDALKQLRRCRQLLGRHGYRLVASVCAEGFNLIDLYPNARRARDTAADLLRVHLDELAELWRLDR